IKHEIEPQKYEEAKAYFLRGYRSEYTLSEYMLSLLPVFRRFADLYGYARILWASAETWNNEPEWLIDLRSNLVNLSKARSLNFGSAL
ncbi:MAG: hypothetical protein Q8880_13735, partial [Bacteroidota bacterium]|nr:hypothetical protein [Bacteroidota bacterium]